MPRTCTVCRHADRALIDKALLENTPYRHIESQYGTSTTALQRHKANDLPRALIQSKQAEEVLHGTDLVSEMQDLTDHALAILAKAEKRGDLKVTLSAIGEVRKNKELLARLKGEFEQKPAQVTTTLNLQMIRNQIASEPGQILQWIAGNRRIPTAEERQQLLAVGDSAKADEPPEEG